MTDPIKLPVAVVIRRNEAGDMTYQYIVDADGDSVAVEDIAAALNATAAAPDLTALREAVEEYRQYARLYFALDIDATEYDKASRAFAGAAVELQRAALALFPQDGDA